MINAIIAIITLILFLPLIFIFIKNKNDIFLLLLSLVFLIAWISDELMLLPHYFTWSIELIIATLFINFLLPKIIFFKQIKISPFGKYIILLLTYCFIGAIIYLINFNSLLIGFRAFFKFTFLFFIFINADFSQKSYKKFFKYWLYFMAIQPIVALYQYSILGYTDDLVYGTLVSTGIAAIMLIIFIILLIDLINKTNIPNYILYLMIFLSMSVIPILGEAKAFFYFLPIIFFIRYGNNLLKINFKNILQFVLPFLLVVYLFQSFYKVNLFEIGGINTSDFLFSQGKGGIEAFDNQKTLAVSLSERFLSIVSLYDAGFFGSDLKKFFFGEGIGSNVFVYESREGFLLSSNEAFIKKFSLSNFIQNIGFIGFLIFVFVLFEISRFSIKASKSTNDKFFISVYKIIPAFSALFMLAMFYTNPFTDVISFSYWFFVSSLYYSSEF